jgi:hypothetical protein
MVTRIILGALAIGALVALVAGLPDLARYVKSREM